MEFSLANILLLAVLAAVIFQFWRIRAISEYAKTYLEHYCAKQGLQLISVARTRTRLGFARAKLDWETEFQFEFSSTGEERYVGAISLQGLKVVQTDLPAFRIN